jgi:peptidoglycan hydrolase-like protein with peptidoglycan-binding domain
VRGRAWHRRAGIAIPSPEKALLARSGLDWGTPLAEPRIGCTAVFRRGKEAWQGHIGIVVGWTATTIRLLSGNQSDAVTIEDFPRSDLLGLRWPPETGATTPEAVGSDPVRFRGDAIPLRAQDVIAAADRLDCDEALIRALMDVEASGKGFGPDGRPTIRFEPHVFRREIKATGSAAKIAAAAASMPAGGGTSQSARYQTLDRAMAIDEAAALKSASWGLGQVMGFNHGVCGFADVRDFVRAMCRSEGDQLMAVAAFIAGNKLDAYLRSHNWRSFARGYNGPGYEANAYHTKLASAYAKRARQKDAIGPATILRMGDKGEAVKLLQRALNVAVDGDFGPETRGAVMAFQQARALLVDGEAGPDTLSALDLIQPQSTETEIKEIPDMEDTKKPWASLGITGPLLGLVVYGINTALGASDAVQPSDVTKLIDGGSIVWTVVTAVWGRWRATKSISLSGQ